MAYNIVTHTIAGSSDNDSVTSSAIDTTGASLLVVPCAWYPGPGSSGTPAVTDSKTNTWAYGTTYTNPNQTLAVRIAYAVNPTVGSGHTFTASSNFSFPSIAPSSWSGGKTVSPFDQENGDAINGTPNIGTGSITPTEDNELLIACGGWALHDDTTVTIDAGFNPLDQIAHNGNHDGLAVGWLIQTTAGAASPAWTFSNSSGNNEGAGAAIASFKAPAGTPAVPDLPWMPHYRLQAGPRYQVVASGMTPPDRTDPNAA